MGNRGNQENTIPLLEKIRFTYFNKKKEVGLILGFAAKMSRDFALLRQQACFISDHTSTHNQGFG